MIYSANTVLEAVGDYYEDLAGRDATDAELSFYLGRYRANPDLGAIRTEIARTPDARDALARLFRSVVGTEPDPARLDQLQQALVDGATLDGIGDALEPADPPTPDDGNGGPVLPDDAPDDNTPGVPDDGNGEDQQDEVSALYEDVLGRVADPAGLGFWSQSGAPLQAIREALASSAEARAAVNAAYSDVLGREGDNAGLDFWQSTLASGASLGAVRSALAGTGEARDALDALYADVLDRPGDAAGLAFWQGQVVSGASLDDVRAGLARTDEARDAVNELYEDVFGRAGDDAGLDAWQEQLAGGADLDGVRTALAGAAEARDAVNELFEGVLGRGGDGAGLAFWQMRLVGGSSLPDVRAALAGSNEAQNAVSALYGAVLGRNADAAGLEFWRGLLASTAELGGVRAALAGSSEAAATLAALYEGATGTLPDDAALQGYVARLSGGDASLDALRGEIEVLAPAQEQSAVQPGLLGLGGWYFIAAGRELIWQNAVHLGGAPPADFAYNSGTVAYLDPASFSGLATPLPMDPFGLPNTASSVPVTGLTTLSYQPTMLLLTAGTP